MLVVDAFSGDAIPTHLITREAGDINRQQLDPQGVLAIHISNRYRDLDPVVRGLAEHLQFRARASTPDAETISAPPTPIGCC